AAGPLGLATSRALLEDGLEVVMADVAAERLESLAADLGPRAHPLPLDVSDPAAVEAAVARARRARGGVDRLVNNAGILSTHGAADTAPDEWRRVLAVTLDGAFYLARAVLPDMRARRWGRIVNTCSLAAKSGGITAGTAYTTSKGALIAL